MCNLVAPAAAAAAVAVPLRHQVPIRSWTANYWAEAAGVEETQCFYPLRVTSPPRLTSEREGVARAVMERTYSQGALRFSETPPLVAAPGEAVETLRWGMPEAVVTVV